MLVTVIKMLISPQMNTIERACCHVKSSVKQMVYTKYDISPIPAACASGRLARNAIISVPQIDAIIVARNTAPHSIPVWLSRLGATTMM